MGGNPDKRRQLELGQSNAGRLVAIVMTPYSNLDSIQFALCFQTSDFISVLTL